MERIDWSKIEPAQEGEYRTPPAGGYVLQIKSVNNEPTKRYLKVSYDILGVADPANEEFVGYYTERTNRTGGQIPLPAMYRSYKESAQKFFRGFLKSLEDSNSGFKANLFDGDETKLVGMVFGAVLGEEEYAYNGRIRTRLKVSFTCATERIAKGDFKVPAIKKVDAGEIPAAQASDGYVPFSNTNDCPF